MTVASMNLATTLTTIDTSLATDVGSFNEAIKNLETNAGISFESALMQYTPSLSAMAAAGQTFADIINGIDSQELADIGAVTTALNNFVAMAGVPLVTALNLASPPMTRLAVALENREAGLLGVDETETAAIATLNTSLNDFVAMAGIPLTTALTLASPPMTRLATALETLESGLLGIDEAETTAITGLNQGMQDFVSMAGIPLTQALTLASPPMTRLAVALETLESGLLGIDETEMTAITGLNQGMQDFVAMAGIPLTTALTLASPSMTLLCYCSASP